MSINSHLDISAIMNRIDYLERQINHLPSVFARSEGFWAQLTAATSVTDNFWRYSFSEVNGVMSGSNIGYEIKVDGRVGPITITGIGATGYAWNTVENPLIQSENDTCAGWSDDILTTDDGDQITIEAVQPIGTTQKNTPSMWPIVWMRQMPIRASGHLAYVFSAWNVPRITASGS